MECQGVYQVMSAIFQYQSNLAMIRPDDWSGDVMIRVLHDVKYFLPIIITRVRGKVEMDKAQLEMVIWFADQVLDRNATRGRAGKSPLKYEEVRAIAVSASNLLFGGSGIGLGWDIDMASCKLDPYTAGVGVGEDKDHGGQGGQGVYGTGVKQGGGGSGGGFQKPKVKAGRGRGLGHQGGGQQGVGGAGQQHQQRAAAPGPQAGRACRDWNRGACPFPNSCKYSHFCNKVVFSFALDNLRFQLSSLRCWRMDRCVARHMLQRIIEAFL